MIKQLILIISVSFLAVLTKKYSIIILQNLGELQIFLHDVIFVKIFADDNIGNFFSDWLSLISLPLLISLILFILPNIIMRKTLNTFTNFIPWTICIVILIIWLLQ